MTNDDHNELESLLREVRELLPKCRVCLLADFHEVIQRAEAAGDFEAVVAAYIWLLRPRRKPGRRREAKQAAQEPAQGPKGRTPPQASGGAPKGQTSRDKAPFRAELTAGAGKPAAEKVSPSQEFARNRVFGPKSGLSDRSIIFRRFARIFLTTAGRRGKIGAS